MFFKRIACMTLAAFAGFACAANVLTYTATSTASQKDADQRALEGVAKQMQTKVKSKIEVQKTEDAAGNISETTSIFKASYTNVVLKGAKVVPGPKQGGKFQSTVTVDLDQLASKILLDMQGIRDQMHVKDSVIRLDMVDRDYRKMNVDMIALEKLAEQYEAELENLSCVQTVPANLKLESTLGELTEYLISGMSSLTIETDLTSEALVVTIEDFAGPVTYFPVALTQNRKDLANDKTNEEGVVVFPLSKVKSKQAQGEVTVHADLNFKFIRQSAVISKTVSYKSDNTGCVYRLMCEGGIAECGAMQKFLSDAGFSIRDDKSLPALNVSLNFSDKANSGKSLYTSKATVKFKTSANELVEMTQGVGRDEESGHTKAISKLPAAKIVGEFSGKKCVE